jgi:membrane-associated phospholipid phosphatase
VDASQLLNKAQWLWQMWRKLLARVFPKGPIDLLRQIAFFLGAYMAYRYTQGAIDDPIGTATSFSNARDLISIEQSTGTFVEPAVHHFFRDIPVFRDFSALLYMNAQTVIVSTSLLYIYFRHNDNFYFVRNMFIIAMGIALVCYAAFPTAPPRFFFAEYNFVDVVSSFTGVRPGDPVNDLFNPYAAVPSMHCAFALMISVPLAKLSKHRVTRIFWTCYPALMVWCVIVTANHWWLDAAAGFATAGVAAYAAGLLARARPEAWAFQPARQTS